MSHEPQSNGDANRIRVPAKGMTPERLTETARDYFLRDFPNPSEHGCPPRGTLAQMASTRGIPDERLRTHIFGCSECFREYRAALPDTELVTVSRWQRFARFVTLPVPAYVTLAALVVFAAALLIWLRNDGSTHVVTNTAPPGMPQSVPSPPGTPASDSELATNHQIQEPVAESRNVTRSVNVPHGLGRRRERAESRTHVVRIDLATYAVLRSAEVNGAVTVRPTVLRAARNRLLITLPENSPAGEYHVTVVDADGDPLMNSKAVRPQGNTLAVSIDLTSLAGRKGRLRVAREGESPDFFPVEIESRKR
jgi:hypothetical protein